MSGRCAVTESNRRAGGRMVEVSVGGERRVVGERTGRIIRWLAEEPERLDGDRVRLTVNCARRSLKFEVTRFEDVPEGRG